VESLEMTDSTQFRPELTIEEQRAVHNKVSKDCLKFFLDNFIDIIEDDARKTPIVSSALIQIVLEFCLNIAPDKIIGFALLHQVLAQVSVNQIKSDMIDRISEYEGSLTEEQKERLEKIFGVSVDDLKKPDDTVH
jgi:hypothetical protein|tara:strand:- start:477 stop:881 length:405 start_codon:yes stop_codon:yes gene_type:complete